MLEAETVAVAVTVIYHTLCTVCHLLVSVVLEKKEFHDTTLKTVSGIADRTDVLGRVATPKHQRMVVPLNSLRSRLSIKTIKPLLGRTMSV